MQDEDKLQRAHNEVPTHDELNQRLARSEAELATFRAIDADMDCTNTPLGKCPTLGSYCRGPNIAWCGNSIRRMFQLWGSVAAHCMVADYQGRGGFCQQHLHIIVYSGSADVVWHLRCISCSFQKVLLDIT